MKNIHIQKLRLEQNRKKEQQQQDQHEQVHK